MVRQRDPGVAALPPALRSSGTFAPRRDGTLGGDAPWTLPGSAPGSIAAGWPGDGDRPQTAQYRRDNLPGRAYPGPPARSGHDRYALPGDRRQPAVRGRDGAGRNAGTTR